MADDQQTSKIMSDSCSEAVAVGSQFQSEPNPNIPFIPFAYPQHRCEPEQHKPSISALQSTDFETLSPMTFPAYRTLLKRCATEGGHDDPGTFARVARDASGAAIALVLVRSALEGGFGAEKGSELTSLFVSPQWRRQGLGLRLLQCAQDESLARGCNWLETSYTTRMPAWQAFETLLVAAAWPQPQPGLLMSMGRGPHIFEAPLLQLPRVVPTGFELFNWSDLKPEERVQLQNDVDAGHFPAALVPFADGPEIESDISVGLRHEGAVVAWMIVIRSPFVTDALCYRTLFVRPHLRAGRALGPLLLAEAIHRHKASAVHAQRPVGVFSMSLESSSGMVKLFRKRLSPYCFSTYESRRSRRLLHTVEHHAA